MASSNLNVFQKYISSLFQNVHVQHHKRSTLVAVAVLLFLIYFSNYSLRPDRYLALQNGEVNYHKYFTN